jgi:hypothetical protein
VVHAEAVATPLEDPFATVVETDELEEAAKQTPSQSKAVPSGPLPDKRDIPDPEFAEADYRARRAAEERIRQALAERTEFNFFESPLEEIVDDIATLHEIEIYFDRRALERKGIGTDTPVTLDLSGITLKSALRLLLRDLGLDYIVADEVLTITTRDVAQTRVETRVYNARRLSGFRPETLAKVIRSTIRPETWDQGNVAVEQVPGGLVITQSQRVHGQIADLFRQLERHLAEE